jgi:parvulin-like peptidyl-prolyl isomerase
VPTVSPFAARVNGQDIPVEAYQRELRRYLLAEPGGPAPDSPAWQELAAQLKDTVLDALIEQALIEQEAAAAGIAISDAQVDQEMAALVSIRGGREPFDAWLAANQQAEPDVRELVRRELTANAMRDRIVSQLPRTAEYVRAYHIVVATQAGAESIQASLAAGAQFAALAQSQSIDDSTRPDGGDLGWFTRGTGAVLWTEVEDAAFALQPGQVSPIVQSPVGFHVIKVTDRQTRALTAEDTSIFQQAALQRWLAKLKESARIEKFL